MAITEPWAMHADQQGAGSILKSPSLVMGCSDDKGRLGVIDDNVDAGSVLESALPPMGSSDNGEAAVTEATSLPFPFGEVYTTPLEFNISKRHLKT